MVIRSALVLEKQNVHPGSPRFVGSVQLAVKQYNWFVALPIRESASMVCLREAQRWTRLRVVWRIESSPTIGARRTCVPLRE